MKITVNGKLVDVMKGETILEVLQRNEYDVPTLCYHSDVNSGASCRMCVLLANGRMVASCSTKIEEGMEIITESEEIEKARKINLELLFSQHQEECNDCIWNTNCKMLDLAKKYNVEINRFTDRKTSYPLYRFGPVEFDSSKCIDCRNCVDICKKQGVDYLEIKGKGHLFEIIPSQKENKECIYCGQCIIHCPSGAFESVGEFEDIEKPFEKKDKTIIFQIAPSVRSTVGEEFGMTGGAVVTKKLVSSLLNAGGDKVFDVSTGADFTTVEESREFLEKVERGELPMFTSCCPAWVRFVEFYYPEFVFHLTTVRSPHIILGGIIKNYYAKRENIDPEKIMVISVMPCVAKKYEIERDELKIDGIKPVDYVMTTREVGRLFKRNKIDFPQSEERDLDNLFGEPSGSGVSYGASGGVMRSAFYNISGKDVNFKEVRKGLSVAEVEFQDKNLKLAVVNGLGNAKMVLEELKKDPKKYDYLEVMACYGGCLGGGGQSVPTEEKIRQKRKEGLSVASDEKKIKKASNNPCLRKVYEDFLTEEDIVKLCYTKFLG